MIALPTLPKVRVQEKLRPVTLRDFSGGWNVLDDDMNMPHKYAKKSYNVFSQPDGTIQVRYGTDLFSDLRSRFAGGETIINAEYFVDSFVVVSSVGKLYRVLADGTHSLLSTGLWNATEFVSFATFNNHLVLCNGSDKPLDIDEFFTVGYLQDEATGSNLNVPICKYVLAINRYLVMAGDPLFPNRVHISAKDARGTWFGDPPPNDGTHLDVGSVLPSANIIRGLMAFRGKVVVMFAEGLVFGTLGVYNDTGSHTPSFEDGVEGFGSVSHRAGVAYGDDGLFLDLEGVPSIKRTILSASFKPERVSDVIDPEIKEALSSLNFDILENKVFSVYNKSDAQFMLFVPSADLLTQRVFVYNYRPTIGQKAWCEFGGWNFVAAIKSQAGNIFFCSADGRIWLYGNRERPYATDFIDNLSSPASVGIGISFDYEFPWIDFGARTNTKTSKYIGFDTRGRSEFTCEMYVDNILEDVNGPAPALTTEFSGGEQGGFGHGPQPYGGGRNTANKKLYAWPSKFEIMKLRFHGTSDDGLAWVSVSMQCLAGGIMRP
ncbi:MAG TPA: hypothetical protein VLG09_04040 [Candidatus Saccharimonadales bacterium]|nr:hypothetical protein [Candidatus Saccharimonadales bacterium]